MPTKAQTTAAQGRISELRTAMRKAGVDGLVISNLPYLHYLFGYSGSMGMALVTRRALHFFTNDLYTVQVEKEVYKLTGLKVHIDRNFWGVVKDKNLGAKLTTVGFLDTETTVRAHKTMRKALAPAKLVAVDDIISPIIQVKTKAEIKSIAKAAQMASTAYEQMLGWVKPGVTEREVAAYLASATRMLGSEKDAFDIIAVGGPRSAMPHGRASSTKLKKGDVITVDFGCCVDGLFSDMTRTFALGTPSRKVQEVFAVLYDAHLSALDTAQAGVNAAALDEAARAVIAGAGYGDYFRHSLGHGLGYEVHEDPRVSYTNTSGTIAENTVITIEPGIYLPGKFGMRIEDDVVIKKNGIEILTTAPRELVVV